MIVCCALSYARVGRSHQNQRLNSTDMTRWLAAMLTTLLAMCGVTAVRRPPGLRVNRALRATHSRREANRLIATGRLLVNDVVVTNPDMRLMEGDRVLFDGEPVSWNEADITSHRYLKFYKPAGVVTTTDQRAARNIIGALDAAGVDVSGRRIFPVGRLDADSTGLLLLTSDGAIVNTLLRAREGKDRKSVV